MLAKQLVTEYKLEPKFASYLPNAISTFACMMYTYDSDFIPRDNGGCGSGSSLRALEIVSSAWSGLLSVRRRSALSARIWKMQNYHNSSLSNSNIVKFVIIYFLKDRLM